MKEILLNSYIKIQPLIKKSFIPSDQASYQELGTVLAIDKDIISIKVGDVVKFDRFLAFKFPIEASNDFEWYVKYADIISTSRATK